MNIQDHDLRARRPGTMRVRWDADAHRDDSAGRLTIDIQQWFPGLSSRLANLGAALRPCLPTLSRWARRATRERPCRSRQMRKSVMHLGGPPPQSQAEQQRRRCRRSLPGLCCQSGYMVRGASQDAFSLPTAICAGDADNIIARRAGDAPVVASRDRRDPTLVEVGSPRRGHRG